MKASAANRAAMVKRFGFVPMSVLRLSRGALSRSMYTYQSETPSRAMRGGSITTDDSTDDAKGRASARKARGMMIGGSMTATKGGQRIAASIMAAELVEFFVKYYAKPGDLYLDPFMGQGVRMQVAHRLGLHYVGTDVSEEFFRYVDAVRKKIDDGTTRIETYLADARDPHMVPDGAGDFSFHSPPYWDIEYYGDEPGQLGSGTYDEFLAGMEQVAKAWLPKFRQGAFHVVNVNDFRREGRFYAYHSDTIVMFKQAGWRLHDTWIVDGLIAGLPRAFAVDKNSHRIAPKVHEYALVFCKP
jgi:hypothetical protein